MSETVIIAIFTDEQGSIMNVRCELAHIQRGPDRKARAVSFLGCARESVSALMNWASGKTMTMNFMSEGGPLAFTDPKPGKLGTSEDHGYVHFGE